MGRADQNEVKLRDRSVSRRHAVLVRTDTAWLIQDGGGPNGVLVNGRRIAEAQSLYEGDVIELGNSILRFAAGATTTAAPAVQSPEVIQEVGSAEAATIAPAGLEGREDEDRDWRWIAGGTSLAACAALLVWGALTFGG
jgi:pSer/pThr/pTyr-binding forkhead associated (FHA) protein